MGPVFKLQLFFGRNVSLFSQNYYAFLYNDHVYFELKNLYKVEVLRFEGFFERLFFLGTIQ